MANGQSSAVLQNEAAIELFTEKLTQLCVELAVQIPADGEGATHLINIKVSGADSDSDADTVARAVAMSNLVKTAVAGADPNRGRITSAAGLTPLSFKPEQLCLSINGTLIFNNGQPVEYDESSLSQSMAQHFETCIEFYVKFNSLYTT